MNEFEWRHQLRALRQPVMPQRELWPAIDAMLHPMDADHRQPVRSRSATGSTRWLLGSGLAASIAVAGLLGWHLWSTAQPTAVEVASPGDWRPSDPRLTGAAIELDTARLELRQALQQSPRSAALQRLLTRTRQQQAELRQLTRKAG